MSEISAVRACNEWPKIEDTEVLKIMTESQFPMWKLVIENDVPKLIRSFVAKGFQSAMNFLVDAGKVAETRGHHPDLHLTGYRNVTVEIFTHSLSGLTQNDFDLAEAIDKEIKVEYSPNFLKENPHCGPSSI